MDKKLCPICGQKNNCAVEDGKDPKKCWCTASKMTDETMKKLQKAKKENTGGCFCRSCVEKYSV
ncbi:MAG: cysteine-rich CWC family protein [Psychrilyobacter sp.]|nr:cysteine-rich CWC family protein [Psychrilyobacter sp.]